MPPPAIADTVADSARRFAYALRALRLAGLIAILVIAAIGVSGGWGLHGDSWASFIGVVLVASLLWLTLSGTFGFGSACRGDWVALVPFAIALLLRELFTLHSVQEIEIQFARGPVGRHSVVYPLLQMFFVPLTGDLHRFTMHMNGVLGALACLGMYLFVRQRTHSRSAGFLCALFLATHPLVVRFSPTDGPYALLLASWFCGLALLSAPRLDARGMFGGAALLGLAATTRIEGLLFLAASLLLLDPRQLLDHMRRLPVAAADSLLAVTAQVVVHLYVLLPFHMSGTTGLRDLIPTPDRLFTDAVWPAPYNHPVFMGLVCFGGVAGIVPKLRLGLLAYLAMLLVLVLVVRSWGIPVALHRMIPTCALQALVAGMGAWALMAWLPLPRRWRWCAVIPGSIAAFMIVSERSADLTKAYVFNDQYDLVRAHLAPAGVAETRCTLLTCNLVPGADVDLHDFEQVVPGLQTIDCRNADCIAAVAAGGCFYYVRSAGCYFHAAGVPAACRNASEGGGASRACLDAPIAAFEEAVDLEAVEVRSVGLLDTFSDRPENYPITGEVGLFRVQARSRTAS